MKVGILITARLGSSRLRRKHLLPVGGKPILAYLIDRINYEFADEIAVGTVITVIATSEESENHDFEIFSNRGTLIFFGAIDNIPLRHLQAAQALNFDAIVAVDGDDILCSVRGMRTVYNELSNGSQYVKTTGLPFGMNCFGYSTKFLRDSLEGHSDDVLETGWGKIFDETYILDIIMQTQTVDERCRFTLDYEDDYKFFTAVIESLGDAISTVNDNDIIQFVKNNGFIDLNKHIAEEYWSNFYRCIEKEKES